MPICRIGSVEESLTCRTALADAERHYAQQLSILGISNLPHQSLAIWQQERLIGLLKDFPEQHAVSPFVLPAFRSHGIGDAIVELLVSRGDDVLVHERCGTRAYFQERGYWLANERDGLAWLRPPTLARGLREAASVCLFSPQTQEVLIGRRLTPPWYGYWAFPGGKLDAGESAVDAAFRELWEETGIAIADRHYTLKTRVYARGGDVLYVVDNFCTLAPERPLPQALSEIEACWVPLHDALVLRPMAAGTRRVVRRVAAEFTGTAT